ncbi:hypothetical protein V6N13_133729 [Hibiscus sabdariffa]|uniref:Uncharacterized protein n=1 Tax=Hibiscus sabdariffa TaxID=183260 RepID=A0ABR2R0X4_9ROSI
MSKTQPFTRRGVVPFIMENACKLRVVSYNFQFSKFLVVSDVTKSGPRAPIRVDHELGYSNWLGKSLVGSWLSGPTFGELVRKPVLVSLQRVDLVSSPSLALAQVE